MARVLLILSIVIGLITAFLGFKTKQQADALQQDLSTTKSTLATTQQKLKKTEADLADTKKTLEETQDTLKKTEEDLTNTRGELQNTKTMLASAQAEVEAKSKQLADLEKAMEEIVTDIPGGDIKELVKLPGMIKELSEQKTKIETELAEARTVQESLKQRADELESQVQVKEREVQAYKQNIVRVGLQGKVIGFNPGWNFVVLNIGDRAGLKNGVQMVVTRGGQMIGKVRVTTVEPNTAIADVLPGTFARGASVQPGDTVIFQGDR